MIAPQRSMRQPVNMPEIFAGGTVEGNCGVLPTLATFTLNQPRSKGWQKRLAVH
jgi:hypothetical protein